jgi:hypothetical protein
MENGRTLFMRRAMANLDRDAAWQAIEAHEAGKLTELFAS